MLIFEPKRWRLQLGQLQHGVVLATVARFLGGDCDGDDSAGPFQALDGGRDGAGEGAIWTISRVVVAGTVAL